MIGAIIGDVVGSRFERHNNKSKAFNLFDKKCSVTDDSVMSLAIAKAIIDSKCDYDKLSDKAVSSMQEFGRKYKHAGYGKMFNKWIMSKNPEPYYSYGNGAGMRVGPCGFAAKSIDEVKVLSTLVTCVTHNHPEGLKGAEAVAVAVFLARSGKGKKEIKSYIQEHYYDVNFLIEDIREDYEFDVTCQGSIPVALVSFFESVSFEDALRNAISVGGDSDTIASMTCVIAEAFYGVPKDIIIKILDYLDDTMIKTLFKFEKKYPSRVINNNDNNSERVCDVIEKYICEREEEYNKKRSNLDEKLQEAIERYNLAYSNFSDDGLKLYILRERSIDLIGHVENLINSIANRPKEFEVKISEIHTKKKEFINNCEFIQKELHVAKKTAMGIGAGIASGVVVASIAPTAALWVASTFGTASTGTAISALSGAAASQAALAWLGGGSLAAGGGGVAAGESVLALLGPIGWGIAGATILASVVIFANNKLKMNKERKEEVESVYKNTSIIKECDAQLIALLDKTDTIRKGVCEQYTKTLSCYGEDFNNLSNEEQLLLGTLVNNTMALAKSLSIGIDIDE